MEPVPEEAPLLAEAVRPRFLLLEDWGSMPLVMLAMLARDGECLPWRKLSTEPMTRLDMLGLCWGVLRWLCMARRSCRSCSSPARGPLVLALRCTAAACGEPAIALTAIEPNTDAHGLDAFEKVKGE